MSNNNLPTRLQGIIPPMVTPQEDRETIDVEGLERLIEHILAGSVSGLFILGTTGEAPGLSYRLRREVIERTCRQVAGRVPVLVGVTDTSFTESVKMARHAADAEADAVVLSAPYYFPAGQRELLSYVQNIAAVLSLPVFLYNMPSHTKLTFEPEVVRRIMELPNVLGLKDSSGDMRYFHQMQRLKTQREDWTLLMGPEELLADAVLSGGDGGVCGGANLCPRLYVDLYEAARDGDLLRTRELHARVMHIANTIYTVGCHPSAFLKGLKCALSCLGICSDVMSEPFQRFGPEDRDRIREHLVDLDLLEGQAATARLDGRHEVGAAGISLPAKQTKASRRQTIID
ncbi:MAG: dihydrodipicolinate synthase family protein [Planctomycetota bacterium]|nr:dihydrodipicolinate synthase family protein [Planctomycetota bacterium]